jgi:hypothetical protein
MTTDIKKTISSPNNAARNMIIGIITTVLVSGTVYLLGFNNKKGRSSKLERQKATTEAWKSYVTLENIYTKNTALLLRDAAQFKSYKELYQESIKESDKFMTGLQGLITNEDVDKDMIAVLKRRSENEEASKPASEKLYAELDVVTNTAITDKWPLKQLQDSILAHYTRFGEQMKGTYDRAISEIEFLSKTLSERYDQPFNMDDFIIIQVFKYKKDVFSMLDDKKNDSLTAKTFTREYVIGKWRTGQSTVNFDADGHWTWSAANTPDAKGTWELRNGRLLLNVTDHPNKKIPDEVWKWDFKISNIIDKSFSMQLPSEGSTLYTLIRL